MPIASSKEGLEAYRHGRGGRLRIDGGLEIDFGHVKYERPGGTMEAGELSYSLTQRGCRFTEILVKAKQWVSAGEVLARGEGQELRASRGGEVVEVLTSRRRRKGYVRVRVSGAEGGQGAAKAEGAKVSRSGPVEAMRGYAREKGVWAEIQSGMAMEPPKMDEDPKAIVVRCVFAEPHVVHGSAVIREDLEGFLEGLEILHRLGGGYATITLTFTAPQSELGQAIRERLRGRAFVHTVLVPVRYPVENPLLLATLLGRDRGWGPDSFWMLDPQGVTALHRAFEGGEHWGTRLVAVDGPGVARPALLEAPLGTALGELVKGRLGPVPLERCAVIRGGIYSGMRAKAEEGLDYGDRGVLVVPEDEEAELFGWLRAGFDRHSWMNVVGSGIRPPEHFVPRTLRRGGLRACVGCGFCHAVCPVGLYPHHLHRLVTHDLVEEAEQFGLLNCVECNCCSYGCVSKLELSRDIVAARRSVLKEES